MPLGEAQAWLAANPHREQGEFVVIVAPGEEKPPSTIDAERLLDELLAALSPSEAAKIAARLTGLPKAALYRRALERSK
jgi:16S rRNA (cytidine1402-2'-O)-methyltransferase